VEWDASTHTRSGERAVTDYLERLLEEAERARVRLALRSPLAGEALVELTGRLASPWLGLYTDLDRWQDAPAAGTARALQMVRAVMPDEENGRCQAAALTALRESGFDGPLLISLEGGPVEHARAVGFYRGVLAAV